MHSNPRFSRGEGFRRIFPIRFTILLDSFRNAIYKYTHTGLHDEAESMLTHPTVLFTIAIDAYEPWSDEISLTQHYV